MARIITAKRPGTCAICHKAIEPGQRVAWGPDHSPKGNLYCPRCTERYNGIVFQIERGQ